MKVVFQVLEICVWLRIEMPGYLSLSCGKDNGKRKCARMHGEEQKEGLTQSGYQTGTNRYYLMRRGQVKTKEGKSTMNDAE